MTYFVSIFLAVLYVTTWQRSGHFGLPFPLDYVVWLAGCALCGLVFGPALTRAAGWE